MHAHARAAFFGERGWRLRKRAVEEIAGGRAYELIGMAGIGAFVVARPVRNPRHHLMTGPDPAPVWLEVEFTVRLREAVEEMGSLERQGTIDPAQLRGLREARHAPAQERVIEELAIRSGRGLHAWRRATAKARARCGCSGAPPRAAPPVSARTSGGCVRDHSRYRRVQRTWSRAGRCRRNAPLPSRIALARPETGLRGPGP